MFCTKCQKFQPLFDVKHYCQLSSCLILAGRLIAFCNYVNQSYGRVDLYVRRYPASRELAESLRSFLARSKKTLFAGQCGGRGVHFLLISFTSLHKFAITFNMLLDTAHPDLHKQFLHSTPILLKATQFHNHRYLAHSVGLRSSSTVPCEQWFLQAGRYGRETVVSLSPVASVLEKPLLARQFRRDYLKCMLVFKSLHGLVQVTSPKQRVDRNIQKY